MQVINKQKLDEERALYGREDLLITNCQFDGEKDGESALKECRNIEVKDSYFNLRYPFWHDDNVHITSCKMTTLCRAALWYSKDIIIEDSSLHGIKALRECTDIKINNCDIDSPEFGWSTSHLQIENTSINGEYAMMRSEDLQFKNVNFKGKYSFQYIENAVFEDCHFDTKDAFWHGKNILVKNCVVKGEYLAWYSENITFENCTIIGTQPFCYCGDLKLINCKMIDTDLAFEKSEVNATITTPIISIKNPKEGIIEVPFVNEIIMDDPHAKGKVNIVNGQNETSENKRQFI